MARFVVGDDRSQSTLFPERLDDYLGEDNPVRAIDVFVDELDLGKLGFGGVEPEATGRPAYHPATLLKIYVYGYLNRVQSSRRLERECQRNIEFGLVDWPPDAGLQDDSRLPQGQRRRHSQGVP
jgi:transposase